MIKKDASSLRRVLEESPLLVVEPESNDERVENEPTTKENIDRLETASKEQIVVQQQQQQRQPPPSQLENFLRIKEIVKKAIAERHTFMIHGRARVIRECLLRRGWCEKLPRKNGHVIGEQNLSVDSNPSALLAGIGNLNDRQNERLLISKMLSNHTVDFLWNASSEWTGWPSQDNKTTIFNRFTRANFTSKVGLCSNVRQMHWYYEAGIANTLFPRCYNISQSDQLHAFIEDYRLTACLSMLKWLIDKVKHEGEESVRSSSGNVPLRALDFAIGRCSDFIGSKSHEDIDQELENVWAHQWEQFICWYYKLLHANGLFVSNNAPIHKYILAARHLLNKVKKFWPQLDMDGTLNIWILKPGNKSRGRGIVLMNKLDDMIAKVNPANKTTDTRFVIQKYIERPLLIYETKFDIRQWFIITNAQPLTLWMYRESYLRFCSQKFSLTDFHESIHLSNNAVQCKYRNSLERDRSLPDENMWDVATFKEYLKCRGREDAWDELIYPGMKQGLVGSLLASQEAMDRRKNSFELYGADFMVMEDFSVWLIEINSHPDMSNSTSVTTKLCRKVMEDTIKVVVDYRENSIADTGDFELVYKQKISCCQAYLGAGLSLHGTRITIGEKRTGTAMATIPLGKRKAATSAANSSTSQESNRVGPVLVDLIEELELQLDHEFYEYLRLRSASGLSRQILPLEMPLQNDRSDQRIDIHTNTITSNINLLLSTSHANLKLPAAVSPNVTGKPPKINVKNLPNKKTSKQNSNLVQANTVEASFTPQSKAFMSKIIGLQKEAEKNKSIAFRKTAKLYCVTRASENQNSNGESSETSKSSKMKEKKIDKKMQENNEKVIPSIPRTLISLNKDKDIKISRSAQEGNKFHHLNRRNRAKSSQIFVDVTDIYAVGLAINK